MLYCKGLARKTACLLQRKPLTGFPDSIIVKPYYIIFSDLDGTLLDHETYKHAEATEAMDLVKEREIPLILCSSKTRAEIEECRKTLALRDPFISENGAAIFFKKGSLDVMDVPFVEYGGYGVIELGIPYSTIKSCFAEIKAETHLQLLGFSEMSLAQVVEHTGLTVKEAELARARDYSEPFLFMEQQTSLKRLKKYACRKGLNITRGGRFYHLTGDNDKGKAVSILKKLYEQKARPLISIGLGDSLNDFPMLENVEMPVLVKKKTGKYEPWTGRKEILYAPDIGPKGWNRAVLDILRHRRSSLT